MTSAPTTPRTPDEWAQRIAAQCDAISQRIDTINAELQQGLEPFRCNRCDRMRPCGCERSS
jgi:hypothetical protein